MKKIYLLLTIGLMLILCGCSNVKQETINYISENVINGNVEIEIKSTDGTITGNGSGVIIAEHNGKYYVITNYHVLFSDENKKYQFNILDSNNGYYEGTVLNYDKDYDLAVISFMKNTNLFVTSLAVNNPQKGDIVFCISNPEGKRNIITTGKVSGFRQSDDYLNGEKVIIHDAPIKKGSSGSMLVNENYQLIGINTWIIKDDNYEKSLAISTETIQQFLKEKTDLLPNN